MPRHAGRLLQASEWHDAVKARKIALWSGPSGRQSRDPRIPCRRH